jgi:hypothetical protein
MQTKKLTTANKRRRARVAPNPNTFGARLQAGMYSTGFPRMMHFTHIYTATLNLTSTTGVANVYQFSANGMFDPDITGTGTQPTYFDQLTPVYDHYTVFRSRCTYSFLADKDANVVMYIEDDTTTATSINSAAIQPSASTHVVTLQAALPTVIRRDWDAKQYFGGDVFDNDDLQGSVSANPVEQSYYTIVHQAQDASSTAVLRGVIRIEYDCVWDELKGIGAS